MEKENYIEETWAVIVLSLVLLIIIFFSVRTNFKTNQACQNLGWDRATISDSGEIVCIREIRYSCDLNDVLEGQCNLGEEK